MSNAQLADRFNDRIAEQTRHAIEDGIACCGAHYWTEGDEHDPNCQKLWGPCSELPAQLTDKKGTR